MHPVPQRNKVPRSRLYRCEFHATFPSASDVLQAAHRRQSAAPSEFDLQQTADEKYLYSAPSEDYQ